MTASSRTERRTSRGFTLLEIMMTIALVGVTIMPILLIRERSVRQSYQAHQYNTVRMLARELLSELEFRELDQMAGEFDGFPGFSYTIEVQDVDLVTGEEEDENEGDNAFNNQSGGYKPADAIDPNEDEEEELDYPARRVTLTLRYPNLKDLESEESLELLIETIFPPLPKDEAYDSGSNPFNR